MAIRDYPVPNVGFVIYNGVIFPPLKSCRVVGVPVPDSSGRTTKYVSYTLSVETVLTATDFETQFQNTHGTIDDAMELVRQRLMATGQRLVFTWQGFGNNVIINGDGSEGEMGDGALRFDAIFGPHPKLLVWEPIGSNRTVRLVWECEFTIPDVCQTPAYVNAISEYNWEANFAINEDGMTTRTITGTIEIPMTRRGRSIPDTVDNYRELIQFPRVPGFIRSEDHTISRDKRILNFRITDTEVPSDNPFYPGIINADVDHHIMSALNGGPMAGGFLTWTASLRGVIRVAPGVPRNFLWLAIVDIIHQRVITRVPLGTANRKSDDGTTDKPVQASWIPLALELTEKVFGRELTFSFTYLLISDLNSIWDTTGLLTPLAGDWNVWTASLSHLDHRGYAKLKHKTSDDRIIDLCDYQVVSHNNEVLRQSQYGQNIFNPDCPAVARSWIIFRPRFHVIESSSAAFVSKATGVGSTELNSVTAQANPGGQGTDLGDVIPLQIPQTQQPTVQGRSHSKWYLRYTGDAYRVCFTPKLPKVAKILGSPAYRVGTPVYKVETIHPGSKLPVYHLTWDILYALPTPITGKLEDAIEVDGLAEDYR